MTRIIIEAVPKGKERLQCYSEELAGDWFVNHKNGDIHIQVRAADVWDEEDAFLIALHELVEARLCFKAGITQGAVDAFDLGYPVERELASGDAPDAPYRVQHRQAMIIEHLMALFLGRTDYGCVS